MNPNQLPNMQPCDNIYIYICICVFVYIYIYLYAFNMYSVLYKLLWTVLHVKMHIFVCAPTAQSIVLHER